MLPIQDLFISNLKFKLDDMRLLFPLSGSSFTFKSRDKETSIKFQISCNKRVYDSRCKNKSEKGVTHTSETSKPFCKSTLVVFHSKTN